MITTIQRAVPETGYGLRRVEHINGSSRPSLLVELAESTNPLYIREDFAVHLQQFLQTLYPKLAVAVEPFSEGQVLSVIGYDREQAWIEMDVRSGDERTRQVLIQPSLDKYIASNGTKSINPRTTIERYKSVLERDLVV